MLLPSMGCAMPVCRQSLTQAQVAAGALGHPHHGSGLVFFKECATTDLHTTSSGVIITRLDTTTTAGAAAGADIFQDARVHPGNLWTISGSPPDWPPYGSVLLYWAARVSPPVLPAHPIASRGHVPARRSMPRWMEAMRHEAFARTLSSLGGASRWQRIVTGRTAVRQACRLPRTLRDMRHLRPWRGLLSAVPHSLPLPAGRRASPSCCCIVRTLRTRCVVSYEARPLHRYQRYGDNSAHACITSCKASRYSSRTRVQSLLTGSSSVRLISPAR